MIIIKLAYIEAPVVKMERKGTVYGKIDLSKFYQSGLKFTDLNQKKSS